MAFIDELMKLQGNQMGRTPVAPFPATPQAPQGPQVQPQTPTDTIQPQTPTPQTGEGGNILSRGFDFFFGPPTPEQAQQTLTTQPTDPAQRENLQAIVRGEERPSSVGKAASFLFGRPDVAGDPNIMGATKPEAVAPQFGLADTTSSTAPTGEDPFSGPIVQPQVPQADPNQQIRLADPTSSTAGLNPTQAMLQERFGAPTISAIQAAPEGLGMRTDPQGRMIDPNADRSFFEQQSAAREQRAEEQFGVARGPDARDRDRRIASGEGTSTADLTDMAKANARGASASDVARGQQVADALGVDLKTGQPLAANGRVSAKERAETDKIQAETAKILSEINSNADTSEWSAGRKQAMKTQAKELSEWEVNQLPDLENSLSTLTNVADELDKGQVETGTLLDRLPASNWTRAIMNPDAEVARQEVSGIIMKTLKETFPGAISNEERTALISTVYNPAMGPEQNAKLIHGYADRLNKAMNAKKSQVAHFRKFGSLENYTGATPREALMGGVDSTGGSGSPIKGDVNYQSDVQAAASEFMQAQ